KNKTSESITGVMSGYGFTSGGTTYDFEDRLTGYARASGTFNQSWNLTSVGNWTSVTTNGIAQNRTHGPTHELLTAGGSSVVTDVKGNITSIPATLRPAGATTALLLSWDFDNKLASADIDANGTADVSFQYDALGRRVARTGAGGSFVFVQMDQQTIADYPVGGAASTPTYRYVYASYIDEPVVRKTAGAGGTLVYFHRNQQYSVTAITTVAGAIAERYAYTAYGLPTILNASATIIASSAISNRYTYTGREWDATLGLHHFRARWMSPIAGRFLGRDPIDYEDGNLLYAFVLQTPLNFVDPSGMACFAASGGIPGMPSFGGMNFKKGAKFGGFGVDVDFGTDFKGKVCEKECPCGSRLAGQTVLDAELEVGLAGRIEAYGASYGGSWSDSISMGYLSGSWWAGIKLSLGASGSASGTFSTDRCNGVGLNGKVCVDVGGTAAVAGGGEAVINVGRFTYRAGAYVEGRVTVSSRLCYVCRNDNCSWDGPKTCVKGEISVNLSMTAPVRGSLWDARVRIPIYSGEKCF
ncbi:MAG: RHS repeat-associated core domain-containing protein, partial [Pirellula sp.]